jgi:lipopolysaccharide transport system ATP-binding protein
MENEIAISVRNLSKKFRLFSSPKKRLIEALHPFRKQYHREFWALKNISFDVYKGEIVGIMGRNGSGKSTLLQIICSVMQATEGEASANGRISALLELGAGFNPEFSGRENVILNGAIMGFSRKEMLAKMPEIEAFADIGEFFDQPVKTYSSGMFVRVAFSAAIHIDPEILIVDEAMSVGDAKFQHRCFQRIREFMEQGKSILVVSHNTDILLRICHRGVVLDAGELRHIGPISSAVDYYAELLYGSSKKVKPLIDRGIKDASRDKKTEASLLPIGSLSNDARDKVAEKTSYNELETRLGNGAVTIVDFDVIVDGEVNPVEIKPHKDVELIVKIRFNESLRDVSFGFAILSFDGTYVGGTNFDLMEAPLFCGEAGECIAIRLLWKSHLSGGEYFLNIGCHRYVGGEKQFLDVRRGIAKLKFADTLSIGFVDFELSHEIIKLPYSSEVNAETPVRMASSR